MDIGISPSTPAVDRGPRGEKEGTLRALGRLFGMGHFWVVIIDARADRDARLRVESPAFPRLR